MRARVGDLMRALAADSLQVRQGLFHEENGRIDLAQHGWIPLGVEALVTLGLFLPVKGQTARPLAGLLVGARALRVCTARRKD